MPGTVHGTPQTPLSPLSPWRRFWERGGVWRTLLFAAVYYALYELLGLAISPIVDGIARDKDGALDVFLVTALPIILIIVVLLGFAASVGWLRELFSRERPSGKRWMWIGIAVVLAINLSSVLSIDYAAAGGALVLTWLATGLCIGVAEELVTRGFVVKLMRRAGHGEIAVGLTSAGVFAAMHFGNVFTSDQGLGTTLLQVVYTFGFGICMYLALRLTGSLWAPILLHASTDPTLFLHGEFPVSNVFGLVSSLSTFIVILTGFTLMIVFIVSERRRARALSRASADLL